ncbi:MAG TPA: DUF6298 domain-containing protein [Pyrinomonadaceae bacterium]|nr:DUF6298 domain-containing protein [Pyrinomonadaceae bacterium]
MSLCLLGLPFPGRARNEEVVIDFSHAGYGGGGARVPSVPDVLRVRPTGRDDTALIQAALDRVASMPADDKGLRGAVLLERGRFRVAGHLRLRASGVVLRGRGASLTTVVATGQSRRTLVEVGREEPPSTGAALRVTDEKVPAGGRVLTLESVEGLAAGDRVVVHRPSTKEWAEALGMNRAEGSFADQRLHWTPGSRDLVWDRTVASVDREAKRVTLDAPVTTALERRHGGGSLAKVNASEPVRNVGVEALTLESEFDRSNRFDEEHSWIAVALDNVEDAWVRDVTARHFAGSAVRAGRRARRVSVEGCRYESPVSEVGGYRRQGFFVEGQQVLVRDCWSEAGTNDFAVGFTAAGPNVFLDCESKGSLGPSGSFESWASGVLYERVRIGGAALRLTNDTARAQGGGWTAANSVIWNCGADSLEARGPEDAPNVLRTSTEPLYEKQLASRMAIAEKQSTFTLGLGAERGAKARRPEVKGPRASPRARPLQIVNGRFVVGGRVVWGGMLNGAWWKGQVSPQVARAAGGVSVTRFVPGRVGPGLTEDLGKLAAKMVEEGTPFFNGGHGLWYDRRRDAHTIAEQPDANVWAPFYEMPWARSGKGKAWDGLSKYDLTRFNPWYFERTREFAGECERRGLVYYHSLYNTHNLLETAAHWVDFPWRPANNVNDTGLPEPPPLDARKGVHLANQFYDASDPRRRALHRAFILHTLDVLGGRPNVVLTLGFQFAGPLAFQQFFLDTVAEWGRAKRRPVRVALITSKDITDAILADPSRSKLVSVIDTRYWQYRPEGKLWAPPGGRNLAFREMITEEFKRSGDAPPDTTPQQVYRQVREYRDRFPEKAVVAWHSGAGPIPVLMAGGAQALMRNPAAGQSQGAQSDRTALDPFVREHLSSTLMKMSPLDGLLEDPANNWCLSDARNDAVLVYSLKGSSVTLARALPRRVYAGLWFDPRTGETRPLIVPPSWDKGATINKPTGEDWLLLLTAK